MCDGATRASRTAASLETLIEKVQSFGGRVEALGQRALDAAFGVEPIEDGPRRAAHAAMAMQRAVERIRGDSPAPLATRIAIHAAQALVAQAGRMIQIDQEAKEQGAFVLDDLIAAAEPGAILDPSSLQIVGQPAHASSVKVHDDHLHYHAVKGYVGGDSISYRICSSPGVCATGQVSIDVVARL